MPRLEPFVHAVLRYKIGKALVEAGNVREAVRYLGSLRAWEPYPYPFRVPAQYYLGIAYETMGNLDSARIHYGNFVRWWEDSDAEFRARWEEGRQALARLTVETSN